MGVDYDNRSIAMAFAGEPPDLNSTTSTDSISFMVLTHVMEGLMSYDQNNNLVGGVAEKWQLREDGATFWLRKDARWSNGEPVTAHDFVFAWRKVVDPANASEYAFILYPVTNSQAINEGKLAPEALGVRALDDHTLEVDLFQPCPYFLGLTAFGVLNPVNQAFYESRNGRYAADVEDMLYNGPFQLTEWVHGASLKMEKNGHYWNRDSIWLNTIDVPYITEDANARLNLYRDGMTAIANGLNEQALIGAMRERMQIKTFFDGAIFFIEFNQRPDRATRSKYLRKAIQSVLNTEDLVYKVIGSPGTYPVNTIFPRWMKGVEDNFVREYPPTKVEFDVELGRRYLDMAKQELGVDVIPPITLLADDSPGGSKTSEYFQAMLKQHLDLDVRVDAQIFKQRLAKMSVGDFDLVVSGWGPDYEDLLTYGDLFLSKNLNNRGRYASEEYDHWVAVAQSSLEPEVRAEAFANMQRLIYEDAIIVPLFERGVTYVQNTRLRDVVRRPIGGDPNFKFAYIEPPESADQRVKHSEAQQ
ncbi:MAG: peptide ABC transporter substrate-binding protein [Candidatus Pelagadaptatus aseana]